MSVLEDMARAMCAAYGDEFDEQPVDLSALAALRPDGVRSHDPGLPTQADWLEIASAGLGTLAVAGYAIVPVGPTEGMLNAASLAMAPIFPASDWYYRDVWRAMLAAAKEG